MNFSKLFLSVLNSAECRCMCFNHKLYKSFVFSRTNIDFMLQLIVKTYKALNDFAPNHSIM